MSIRKLDRAQVRQFRANIAKLKSKGLVNKRVDARSQKPTRHMREQVKKFADVLSGKAKVVHVPKRADAKEFGDKFRVKGKSVVVPVTGPDEHFSYSKKNHEITGVKKVKGRRVRRHIDSKPMSRDRIPKRKKNMVFVIPVGNTRQSFDTWDDLVLFMEPYEANPKNPYKNWMDYVEVVDYEDGEE